MLMVLASRKKLTLSTAWKPTALISVINARTDLTDMEKVKLAAKAKLEGNLNDLLPQKFVGAEKKTQQKEETKEETFTVRDGNKVENLQKVEAEQKWRTAVFTEDADEARVRSVTQEKVNSMKKRFETTSMKNNEAYIIM